MSAEQRFWITLLGTSLGLLCLSYMFYSLRLVLIPFFVGFIGAYAFKNFVNRLEKYRLDRSVASVLVVLSIVLLLTLLSIFAVPYLQQQLMKLFDAMPKVAQNLLNTLEPLLSRLFQHNTVNYQLLESHVTNHLGDLMKLFIKFFSNLVSTSSLIANLLSWVLLTPLIMFYFLKDWPRLLQKVKALIPLKYQDSSASVMREIDQMLATYATSQIFVCAILSILYAIGLYFAGLNEGIVLGLVTGIMSFIPYVGALIGFLASLGLGLAQTGDFSLLMGILTTFIVINLIEGQFLTPRLIGQKIGLHPLWILFALLAGGTWLGFVGLVLTLPMAALIGVLVRLALRTYQNSVFYRGKSHGRTARP